MKFGTLELFGLLVLVTVGLILLLSPILMKVYFDTQKGRNFWNSLLRLIPIFLILSGLLLWFVIENVTFKM